MIGRFVRNPDVQVRGALIYGDDAALVSARRDQLVQTILGDDSPELRMTRLDPAMVRKDPAALFDALRESAFFGGRRLVLIGGATDGLAKTFTSALEESAADDAFLLVTAGSLPARSKLRAMFEAGGSTASAPCYSDSITSEDVSEALLEHGLEIGNADAKTSLEAYRAALDFGAYQQLLAKLDIYKAGDDSAVSARDIEECAPLPDDPESHAIASAVLGGDVRLAAKELARMRMDSSSGASLLIAISWQIKRLYAAVAAIDAGMPRDQALSTLRPPVFGNARAQISRQLDRWTRASLESVLRLVHDAQLSSRSGGGAPPDAATARTLLRIAMMASKR